MARLLRKLNNRQLKRRRLALESLERRHLLTTLLVDIGDPGCTAAGPTYCQIHEAESAAVPGNEIKVASGIYAPVTIDVDNITVEALDINATPIVDGGGGSTAAVSLGADSVLLRGLVARNADPGFLVTGSNNTLIGNTAQDNHWDQTGSGGNGNRGNGFYLKDSVGNTLQENVAFSNDRGIQVTRSDNSTLQDNQAVDNSFAGIEIEDSDNNTLTGNQATNNGVGIRLFASDNNVVQNNAATDNGGAGFLVQSASDNLLENNDSEHNGADGFLTQFSLSNTFTNNNATDNVGDGFELSYSVFNELSENAAVANGEAGFELFDADDNTLQANEADSNDGYGFQMDASSERNVFDGNQCLDNVLGGSNVEGICDVDPVDEVTEVIEEIEALLDDGTLDRGEANPILNHLGQALKSLGKGKIGHAIKKLEQARDKIQDRIDDGDLDPLVGQELIDQIDAAIDAILSQ